MPQVDLPQLFPVPPPPTLPPVPLPDPDETGSSTQTTLLQRLRLDAPQWANVAFVLAACIGAVFCAAYLFKGGELFQEVAAWPRELFYARPTPIPKSPESEAILPPILPGESMEQVAAATDDSGDPFSPASRLLNSFPSTVRRPNGRIATNPFSSASPILGNLQRITPPGAGGAALNELSPSSAGRPLSQGMRAVGSAETHFASQTGRLAARVAETADRAINPGRAGSRIFAERNATGLRYGFKIPLTTNRLAAQPSRQSASARAMKTGAARVKGTLSKTAGKRSAVRNARKGARLSGARKGGINKPWAIFSRIGKTLIGRKSRPPRKNNAKPRNSLKPGPSRSPQIFGRRAARNTVVRQINSPAPISLRTTSPGAQALRGMGGAGMRMPAGHSFGGPRGR